MPGDVCKAPVLLRPEKSNFSMLKTNRKTMSFSMHFFTLPEHNLPVPDGTSLATLNQPWYLFHGSEEHFVSHPT